MVPIVSRRGLRFIRVMIRVHFSRLHFLVIDNAPMRLIIRTLLRGFGARDVHDAEDGASGLEAFNRYTPDIVLTDWAMPIFDGLELTQMIRVSETTDPRGSTSERTAASITATTKASPATNHATLITVSTRVSPPPRAAFAAGA